MNPASHPVAEPTTNDTSGEEELTVANNLLFVPTLTTILAVILTTLTLLTIVFNVTAIFIFVTDRQLSSFSDRLIVNLVLADALIGVLVMEVKAVLVLTGGVWVWGRTACLAFSTVELTVNFGSVLNTLVVTVDHYLSVLYKDSYKSRQTLRLLLVMTVTPWVIVFLLFGAPFIVWDLLFPVTPFPRGGCDAPFSSNTIFYLLFIVTPFGPIIAVPVMDCFIYWTIRYQLITRVVQHLMKMSHEMIFLESVGAEVPADQLAQDTKLLKNYTNFLLSTISEYEVDEPIIVESHVDPKQMANNVDPEKVQEVQTPGSTSLHSLGSEPVDASDLINPLNHRNHSALIHSAPENNTSQSAADRTSKRRSLEDSASEELSEHMDARQGRRLFNTAAATTTTTTTTCSLWSNVGQQEASKEESEKSSSGSATKGAPNLPTKHSQGPVANAQTEAAAAGGEAMPGDHTVQTEEIPSLERTESGEAVTLLKEYALDLMEARLSFVLGLVLVITCTPFESLLLMATLCQLFPDSSTCIYNANTQLLQGCRWIVLLGSTVNPLIIFSVDHRYRFAFFRFLRRLGCGYRTEGSPPSASVNRGPSSPPT